MCIKQQNLLWFSEFRVYVMGPFYKRGKAMATIKGSSDSHMENTWVAKDHVFMQLIKSSRYLCRTRALHKLTCILLCKWGLVSEIFIHTAPTSSSHTHTHTQICCEYYQREYFKAQRHSSYVDAQTHLLPQTHRNKQSGRWCSWFTFRNIDLSLVKYDTFINLWYTLLYIKINA